MEKTMLFPKVGGLLHGGDYNPEQWLDRPDILKEDIRLMKEAGMNSATLGVFSWAVYEPVEGEFHFDWLAEIMDQLYANGIYTILATPSGARPAWLDAAYPEALRVEANGVRNHHGGRHNHCLSSPAYREKVRILDRKLAERFAHHPGLLMWHISNELGGECYCPLCAKRFQEYLADKYDHDIEKLNHAWWTTFWSRRYTDFSQIEPPFRNGERAVLEQNVEWHRFTTYNMNDFMEEEIRTLKEVNPDIPVTTNFMGLYPALDYRRMTPALDAVSWDSYPAFHSDSESVYETMAYNAFNHALMRSMKRDRPFMMMESAPGLVNWHAYNKMRRPGIQQLAALQAVACGSDTVQYFQWRKGRGSYEQFHGAVVDHLGTDDTRIFKEISQVGDMLDGLSDVAGTLVRSRVALLFDWDNRWAIREMRALSDATKCYEETCIGIWKELLRLGVDADVISGEEELSDYDVVVAPMLYMLHSGTAGNLTAFVKRGGQLLATYLTGYVDEEGLCYLGGFPGDSLSELFGIVSEEIDTFFPKDRNTLLFPDGKVWNVKDYAEVLRVRQARVLAVYASDYYAHMPALTCRDWPVGDGSGKVGRAYYLAARVAPEELGGLLQRMLDAAGIPVMELPEGVEYHVRQGEEAAYAFYLNASDQPVLIPGVSGELAGGLPQGAAAAEAAWQPVRYEAASEEEGYRPAEMPKSRRGCAMPTEAGQKGGAAFAPGLNGDTLSLGGYGTAVIKLG